MKNYLLLLLLVLNWVLAAQSPPPPPPPPVQDPFEPIEPAPIELEEAPELVEEVFKFSLPSFPDSFMGFWKGKLNIYTAEGLQQTVPMELEILFVNDSTFTYRIIYGEDREAGLRDYLIRKGDQGPHHWIIDEQDGILLDNFCVGGVLHGPFTVMGSLLYGRLEKRGLDLHYSITSGPEEAYRKSGTTTEIDGEQQRIGVAAFEVGTYQVAVLRKER